ncbi:hypothetical protein EGH21_21740 [Halomicroarcula sp. F13]|uniref:Uncharacterized protein n=1 Tax=Haloarcula rubra TaxID=2487747 RepID=A0AAW4PZF1_9EURY|nr:hypothetical protein [Halomicroarcula rubra]MBX0325647.1 hypothetical protein [Halomicroarcula rubra]
MASIDQPTSHREELGLVVDLADQQFAIVAVLVTIGAPVVAYLSGIASFMFYVHVALGAFWFGLDFFFKFVLGPALDAAPEDAAGAVNHQLIPKIVAVAEPLSVGVIGSGIGLAFMLGYWADPSIWLWGALVIGILMLLNGFGPLHLVTTKMVVELNNDDPDGERLNTLFSKAMQWGLLQTVFMLAIIMMMVGLRGLL